MRLLITGLGVTLVLFAGCASSGGKYAPACVAYEGSTLELADGRFVMDKFTDQVEVDDSGNKKDPFPGYPLSGTYHFEGDVLHLQSDSGTELPNLYRVKNEELHRLLTAEQLAAWKTDGTIDDCALTLGAGSGT
jgi:hypothetical protein